MTSSNTPGSSASRPRTWFGLDQRFLPPLLITGILLAGQTTFGMLESGSRTALAIGTAVCCELFLSRWLLGRWPHLASAYISGISVGILIRSTSFWPYAACAAISITSKYVLRWRGRHLWNPSNFGVSAMLFLYPAAAASLSIQWGNSIWPMIVIWCLGSYIVGRLKRFHICLAYVTTFVLLAGVRTLVTGVPFAANVAPITGPMYQLFVFFMITDPRTTVSSWRGQVVVAMMVGVVEAGLRLGGVIHAPYYALFLTGPLALAIEAARVGTGSRSQSARPAAAGSQEGPPPGDGQLDWSPQSAR